MTDKNFITYRTALICTAAFLTCLGLIAIYASSSIPASQKMHNEFFFVQKQFGVATFGFFFIFLLGHVPFVWVERACLPLFVITILLLMMVHVTGLAAEAKGATRWIRILGITFQPGELAKLALVLFLAKNLSRPSADVNSWSGILPNLGAYMGVAILLLTQPDFGTAALLFAVTFLLLFTAGFSKKFLLLFFSVALGGAIIAVISAPYRMMRLFSFLDPWREIKEGGFQIIQSYVGFQNGGLWGAGLGESRQKLFFLPEAHTDFILSVIGEELGLFGVLLICALFAYMVYLGAKITQCQVNTFRKFLSFGLTCLIGLQAAINMGVAMGMLPTKGITLPFVSHGANSLLVFLLAVAILARISQEVPATAHEQKFRHS